MFPKADNFLSAYVLTYVPTYNDLAQVKFVQVRQLFSAYFCAMIQANELRLGNSILQKVNNRITMVKCSFEHFGLLSSGDSNTIFPIQLKASVLEQCGFDENKNYPLLPTAHEYLLTIPVSGNNKNEIVAYIKSNNECFARAMVNGLIASNPVYYLHQLQNLYYSLTGNELEIRL